jgi:hypothetical protein
VHRAGQALRFWGRKGRCKKDDIMDAILLVNIIYNDGHIGHKLDTTLLSTHPAHALVVMVSRLTCLIRWCQLSAIHMKRNMLHMLHHRYEISLWDNIQKVQGLC